MRLDPSEAAFIAFCILFGVSLSVLFIAALIYLIGVWAFIIIGIFLITWGLVYYIGNKDWKKVKYNWENK